MDGHGQARTYTCGRCGTASTDRLPRRAPLSSGAAPVHGPQRPALAKAIRCLPTSTASPPRPAGVEDIDTLRDCAVHLDERTLAPRTAADRERLAALWPRLHAARIVVLGELDHFIAQKNDFRLWWIRRLAERYPLVLAEELGHSDGKRIARYLASGDETWLDRVPTFGWRGDARPDRTDSPTGVLQASSERFPAARFKATQCAFYRALRELGVRRFHGFDIDGATGAGYAEAEHLLPALGEPHAQATRAALARVPGETMLEEAARLTAVAGQLQSLPFPQATRQGEVAREMAFDLGWTASTLHYAALAYPAADYEALRPAMQFREGMMKRAVARLLDQLAPSEKLVLMAHAFHLAKDDGSVTSAAAAVGPGGDRASSLGHYLARERGEDVCAIWFLFAEGSDCQPFPDLPTTFAYPDGTLNAQLARLADALVLPTAGLGRTGAARVGHIYNLVADVDIARQADSLFFLRTVTPLPDAPSSGAP